MPPMNLNLSNFLKHVDLASDSGTLVMRDDGKTSARGSVRTFFTSMERYRETTRQFIDKFCEQKGNEQFRQAANIFFEENLREENATPLSARSVRAFLSFVKAKEAQTESRWNKWTNLRGT